MARNLAKTFGVLLLLLGIIGFFSNAFIGTGGYFAANAGMNIVNLIFGLVLLAVSGTEAGAGLWLKIVGIIYAVLAIIAFAILTAAGTANVLGFMAFNSADGWLYLIGGVLMVIGGYAEGRDVRAVDARRHAHGHI